MNTELRRIQQGAAAQSDQWCCAHGPAEILCSSFDKTSLVKLEGCTFKEAPFFH
jgi:hypothetical protein